ncbi:uncharacterized protein LOC113381412 [Ctenocephalides felis]|uniref:uncharacterized protein LOC113381412 n=1 Tax=Ctenocephalides felis TaxID=7515 RepID=UPI000E6E1E9D|nr:uncharacterized protein LOC113381412 [Ctenocephalides felis]
MNRDALKFQELWDFIARDININKKPLPCKTNRKNNVISDQQKSKKKKSHNIINKIMNRQMFGEFSVHRGVKYEAPFMEIPDHLRFCLKTEILPTEILDNHVYMGLTACGQFLLSYTEVWTPADSEENVFLTDKLEYRLYFWGFRPHNPCYIVHSVPLFASNAFGHYQHVTMVQWKSMPWLLVVHGYNDCGRHGCMTNSCDNVGHITWVSVPSVGCSSCKKESTSNKGLEGRSLCTRHKILAHTEYDCGSFEPIFKPHVNMRRPGQIVVSTGALMHVLDVQLLTCQSLTMGKSNERTYCEQNSTAGSSKDENECSVSDLLNISLDETLRGPEETIKQSDNEIIPNVIESKNNQKADKTYEFVEEVENCEKIGIFRKRRLADRRYEYHEDTLGDYFGLKWNKYMKLGANTNKVLHETTNSNYQRSQTLNILNDRDAKQNKDFNEKLSNSSDSKSSLVLPEYIVNSPPCFKRKSLLVLEDEDSYKCSITHIRYFVENKADVSERQTSGEEDEISATVGESLPATFHVYLPLSLNDFQAVSQEESNDLIKKEPIVVITQQSFDLETFSYLVSCKLCEKEKKYFKCIQDWYSEILKVSPISGITCILLLHVVAIPAIYRRPLSVLRCDQCIAGDCFTHRKHYEASCLFQWDPTTGYYAVISHTSLRILCPDKDSPQMWRPNRRQASKILDNVVQDNIGWNMRVQYTLNTEISLESITDWDHFIQLNRGHVSDDEIYDVYDE